MRETFHKMKRYDAKRFTWNSSRSSVNFLTLNCDSGLYSVLVGRGGGVAAINTCVLFTFEPLSLSTRLSPPLASPFAAKGRYPRVASLTARKESLPNQNIHTRILFFVAWKTALDISLIYSDTSPLFPPSPLFFSFLLTPKNLSALCLLALLAHMLVLAWKLC